MHVPFLDKWWTKPGKAFYFAPPVSVLMKQSAEQPFVFAVLKHCIYNQVEIDALCFCDLWVKNNIQSKSTLIEGSQGTHPLRYFEGRDQLGEIDGNIMFICILVLHQNVWDAILHVSNDAKVCN